MYIVGTLYRYLFYMTMFKCNYRYIGKILYDRKNMIIWKLNSLFLKLNSDTYMYKQVLVCHTKKRITSMKS